MAEEFKTPGERAFTAYRNHTNGVTFDGRAIPTWWEVYERTPNVCAAWEAAAEAVILGMLAHVAHTYAAGSILPDCYCAKCASRHLAVAAMVDDSKRYQQPEAAESPDKTPPAPYGPPMVQCRACGTLSPQQGSTWCPRCGTTY